MKVGNQALTMVQTPTARVTPAGTQVCQLKAGETVEGLDSLVESGVLSGYERDGDQLILFSEKFGAADAVGKLPHKFDPNLTKGWRQKVHDFLLPTDMAKNCAPEYARFRAWSLAGALVSGVIGFMTTAVYLDSMKVAFSDSEKAALAGVVTGTVQKATQMGGWMLAKQGDSDPKRAFLLSSLIASTNAAAGLGLLAVFPKANFPFYCATAVTGTVAGIVGGAAGVNIFNHMAPGNNKGEVGAKNGNQDMVASCFGMPLGLAMSRLAHGMGVNPAVLAACTLGPLLGLCTIQAARAVRMEAVGRSELQSLADTFLQKGQVPEARAKGVLSSLVSLVKSEPIQCSSRIEFSSSLRAVTEGKSEKLLGDFGGRRYVVNLCQDGKIRVAVQSGAELEQVVQAYAQARLLEQAVEKGVVERWRQAGEADPESRLVELSLRATPKGPGTQELCDKGWHANTTKLSLPTVQAGWARAKGTFLGAPLTPQQFGALLEAPQAPVAA